MSDQTSRCSRTRSRNYKRALEAALADGCDFAVLLEDDVRACHHLRANLKAIPLLRRDQCDYFSLFMPDLIASPWERHEKHLGYRLAKPLYTGPEGRQRQPGAARSAWLSRPNTL